MSRLLFIGVAVVGFPRIASAHLRWFVTSAEQYESVRYPLDALTVSIAIGALLFVVGLRLLDRALRTSEKSHALIPEFGNRGDAQSSTVPWRVLCVVLGIALLDNVRIGVFIAPNLTLPDPTIAMLGAVAQTLLAVILLTQLSPVVASLILLVATIWASLYFPLAITFDYAFELVFVGAALFCAAPRISRIDQGIYRWLALDPERWVSAAVPFARVALALSLMWLAVHNKLSTPALALAFLDEHPLNFMAAIGFSSFTNVHFAFAAGVGEFALGLVLLLGYATRIVAVALLGFLAATVVALGVKELTGHLPIIGVAVLLLLRGSGERLPWRARVPSLVPAPA